MAIEKKTGLFYELMIRGNWDPQKGALGAVTTYQLITGSAIVDTDTNTLAAPYAPDAAVDLTKDQATAFLDGKMADFIDQIASERSAATAAAADAKAAADKALLDIQAQRDAAIADNQALSQKLAKVADMIVSAHVEATGAAPATPPTA